MRRFLRGVWKNRSGTNRNLTRGDPWILVNSFYKAAFGQLADPEALAKLSYQVESGISLKVLAQELLGSAEFQARHGTGQKIDADYITALYRDGLGHEPDPKGLAYWLAEGDKGATRAKALAAFAGSDEAINRAATPLVSSLFFSAFGRLPYDEELANQVQKLRSGISLEVLAEELAGSGEFRTRHRIGQMCCDGNGREPDLVKLALRLREAEKSATRANVLAALARSDATSKYWAALFVNSLYKTACGRLADPEGLADRIHQLRMGVPQKVLAEQIAGSAEFVTRHGSSQRVDVKYLTALYRDGLGRQPRIEELAFWLAEEKKGATRANVMGVLAGSRESLERGSLSTLDDRAIYNRWMTGNDTIGNGDRAAIRAHIAGLPFRPLISVVMPIRETSAAAFRESFNSVIRQLYPNWELCIAVTALTEPLVRAVLSEQATPDARVLAAQPLPVDNFPEATNAALKVVTGEFVVFLRVGDLLAEHALYEMAIEIAANPLADVIYSDHDQIDAAGRRLNPSFKPGFDPDLLLAHDYIGNLVVYRRSLIKEIGCLRAGYEGAEFHDLALRATARSIPNRIRHLPAILYHKLEEEIAIRSENGWPGFRAVAASRRAVRDHLDARGDKDAALQPAPQIPSAIRVVWPVPEHSPLVSVIVPTRDRAELLAKCVEGILHRNDYTNLELLIVDNGSIEPTTQILFDELTRDDARVRVLHQPGPFNYSALNNAAAREANGEILLLLNNDIDVIEAGWMRELVSQALRPDVGIVGAKLLYANERVQHAGIVLGPDGIAAHMYRYARRDDLGHDGQLALPRTLLAVTGACVAIRRAVFFEVGGLDEINLPVAFNDVDLCLRLGDYGYRVVWTPFAELFHLECASRGLDSDDPARQQRADCEWNHMRNTWGSLLETADPFHNPNVLFHWNYHEIPSSPRRRKPWHYIVEEVSNLNRYFPPMNDGLSLDSLPRQLATEGLPGGVDALVKECALNTDQ